MRELNLLPPERRRQLSTQLVLNSLIYFLYSILLGLGLVTLVGLTLGVTFQVLGTYLSTQTTVTLEGQVKRYQEVRTQIAKENESLLFMAQANQDRVLWSVLWPDVFPALPPGTTVSGVSGNILPQPHLSFSGAATSRASLVVLEDRLKQLSWAASVTAPSSNLLQRVNPTYTFQMQVKNIFGKEEP